MQLYRALSFLQCSTLAGENILEKRQKRLSNRFVFLGVVNPSISRERGCHECEEEIGDGSMAVLAENAGPTNAWHPQCFCCHKCKELLVDMIYFFSDGNVYCGRHYAELGGHRCSGCDEVSQ